MSKLVEITKEERQQVIDEINILQDTLFEIRKDLGYMQECMYGIGDFGCMEDPMGSIERKIRTCEFSISRLGEKFNM